MSRLLYVGVIFLTVGGLWCAEPAHADIITITSGVLVGDRDIVTRDRDIVTMDVRSRTRDLSLVGSGAAIANVWDPGGCVGTCFPGEAQTLDAVLSGNQRLGAR